MKTYQFKSDSPWSWIVLAVGLVVVVALAIVFFTAFLVLLGVGFLVAPILRWKRARAGRRGPAPGAGKVIDVDYEVRE